MWFKSGHSLGRKVQAISRALACQYSDSSSFLFLTGEVRNSTLDYKIKRISVETQKYETESNDNFSRNESLDSSLSFLVLDSRSFIHSGWIYIIFPIFKLYIHSFWFKNPRTLLISASSGRRILSYSISEASFSLFWLMCGDSSIILVITSLTIGYIFIEVLSSIDIESSRKFPVLWIYWPAPWN